MKEYFAHRDENGNLQSLSNHLDAVAKLTAEFAAPFRSSEYGAIAGFLHDLAKATDGFDKRLFQNGPKVDHSTFGAQVLDRKGARILGYVVAGHHGGMPDGGSVTSPENGVLAKRLQKEVPPCNGEYKKYLDFSLPKTIPLSFTPGFLGFARAFWVRMLFSCLVDADFLDTELFMLGKQPRGGYATIAAMQSSLHQYVQQFSQPKTKVHQIRTEILNACKTGAQQSPGLFTLTVPTGGGKTISSLSFAMDHALAHNMRRIIYCMPYTSIIEQNGAVFQSIVGSRNVLMHYADAFTKEISSGGEADFDDYDGKRQKLSAENWDSHLIITTNVQFFESLFAYKPSKCRKLHRIANSVIVLDEAQMLPRNYMKPVIRALEELCINYGCTVLMMSATQPSLNRFYTAKLPVRELNPIVKDSFQDLRRVQIKHMGSASLQELATKLASHKQAFCIVNTKRRARELYELLPSENTFHLSTLMLPSDREQTLETIRQHLREGLPCRVVATSMIEAGVDFDFPVGYREEAGLDSIIQAAGRVNREGKRSTSESYLHVFQCAEHTLRGEIRQAALISNRVFEQYDDVTSTEAIKAYFDILFDVRETEMDQKNILALLGDDYGWNIPFKTIAEQFKLIEEHTTPVFVRRNKKAAALAKRLLNGERDKTLLREASAYCVNVNSNELDNILLSLQMLSDEDALYMLNEPVWELLEEGKTPCHYTIETGLNTQPVKGGALIN